MKIASMCSIAGAVVLGLRQARRSWTGLDASPAASRIGPFGWVVFTTAAGAVFGYLVGLFLETELPSTSYGERSEALGVIAGTITGACVDVAMRPHQMGRAEAWAFSFLGSLVGAWYGFTMAGMGGAVIMGMIGGALGATNWDWRRSNGQRERVP
jgi:hypothetical protein